MFKGSMLKDCYFLFILDKAPVFYNASYEDKVKAKLMKRSGSQIQF